MAATQANLEPIFLIYDGEGAGTRADEAGPTATEVIDHVAAEHTPLVSITTEDGVTHRLWRIGDPDEQAAIVADLAGRRALIADGHHRYAAYLDLQAETRASGSRPGPGTTGWRSWSTPTPTRRGSARSTGCCPACRRTGRPSWPRPRSPCRTCPRAAAWPARWSAWPRPGARGPRSCWPAVGRGTGFRLLSHPDPVPVAASMPTGASAPWRRLDASVLQQLLIGRLWGITDSERDVLINHDAADAVRAATSTGATAVISNPLSFEAVIEIAAHGERVPRKSTSFGPKPRTGLVLRTFGPAGRPAVWDNDPVDEDITPLGHDVFQIDTRMAGYDGITAGYLIRGDRPCLVETGTAPSAPVVRDALARLGIGAGDLATVVVTHIHLDHAGGAGDIAAMYPGAQIVVHQRGARHLADPSRLMAGARMVYGDALDRFFGVLAPVPADRIVALEDTGTVDLGGGRRLDSYYSPGHAKHHVGLVDSDTGDLYTGDAAGVYIPDTGDLRPATPPPDFDLEIALASVRRFAALRPTRLLFSHYGPVTEVAQTLERSAEEIRLWVEETRRARAAGLDLDHAVAMVVERTKARYAAFDPDADPALAVKFDRISGSASNVSGIMHWLDQTEAANPTA